VILVRISNHSFENLDMSKNFNGLVVNRLTQDSFWMGFT